MKRLKYLFRVLAITVIALATHYAHAQNIDYLLSFKVPVQQTYCISKALNGDMAVYKKCMLSVEKGANKCDKETKPAYDNLLIKHIANDSAATEYMDEIKPIIKKHFDCLRTLY